MLSVDLERSFPILIMFTFILQKIKNFSLKNILLFTFLFISINCFSQLEKNTWLIGGMVNFSSTKYLTSNQYFQKITEADFNTGMANFVSDKLAGGLRGQLRYRISKDQDLTVNNEYTSFELGPFIRYYFLEKEGKLNLLLDASYQFRLANISVNSNSINFMGGPVLFLNDIVGLEFIVGYSYQKYNSTNENHSIKLNIGLQLHLVRDKS
jgi:hypothetical protein